VVPENIHTWVGHLKGQNFKEEIMNRELKFPEGWEHSNQKSICKGGMDIFRNQTITGSTSARRNILFKQQSSSVDGTVV